MKFLRALLLFSGSLACLSVAWLAWNALPLVEDARMVLDASTLTIGQARETLESTDGKMDAAIVELRNARLDVNRQLSDIRVDAVTQIAGARADAVEIAGKLDDPLAAAGDALDRVREEMRAVQPAMESVAHAVAQIDAALPGILQPLREMAATMPETARAGQAVALAAEKSTPPILRNVQRITGDSSVLVHETVRAKPNWLLRLLGFGRKK